MAGSTDKNPKTTSSSPRTRGSGFPVLSLKDAVDILKLAGQSGWTHTLGQFAEYMGHSTTNSGRFKLKMSALSDFGLISRDGEAIAISPVGQRIALPEDPLDATKAIRAAFRSCDIFVKAYDNHAKNTPLASARLESYAVHSLGVSLSRRDEYARSFIESVVFAGLAEKSDDGSIVLLSETQSSPAVQPEAGDHVRVDRVGKSKPPTENPVVFSQRWPLGQGAVHLSIESGQPLPGGVFRSIGSIVELIERLVAEMSSNDSQQEVRDGDSDQGLG